MHRRDHRGRASELRAGRHARFAWEEWKGDRSLDYWRKAHWDFFSRTLPAIGKEPGKDMLVCERFRVIYQRP